MEKKKITNNNQTYANMNQKTNSNLCMNLKSDAKVRFLRRLVATGFRICDKLRPSPICVSQMGSFRRKKKKYRKKLGGQKIIAYLCNRIYIKV